MRVPTLQLVGLAGEAGSGKDTIARLHLAPLGYVSLGLADRAKINLVAAGAATVEEVFVTKPVHVRQLLQDRLEAERVADVAGGRGVHARGLLADATRAALRWGTTRVAVTDVRHPEDIAVLRDAGAIILKVHAPARVAASGLTDAQRAHPSERALDGRDELFDGILDNDPEYEATVGAQVQAFLRAAGLLPMRALAPRAVA